MALTTIYVTSGLDATGRRRARNSGPRAVWTRSTQADLLASAGFVDIDEVDITAQFESTARAWITESEAHADAFAALEAPGAFEERQQDRRRQLRAIEDGILRRGLFSATRPGR